MNPRYVVAAILVAAILICGTMFAIYKAEHPSPNATAEMACNFEGGTYVLQFGHWVCQ